jgi:hypothetical protein
MATGIGETDIMYIIVATGQLRVLRMYIGPVIGNVVVMDGIGIEATGAGNMHSTNEELRTQNLELRIYKKRRRDGSPAIPCMFFSYSLWIQFQVPVRFSGLGSSTGHGMHSKSTECP